MTTLISKDEKQTLSTNLVAHKLENGDLLLTGEQGNIEEWLESNGLSSVFFNPEFEPVQYSDYLISEHYITLCKNWRN